MGYHSAMDGIIQLFVLTTVGVLLLWFGYTLFFGFPHTTAAGSVRGKGSSASTPGFREGVAGMPRTCPVCSARLEMGERVKSSAFPSMGANDRLMHILGCPFCMDATKPRPRRCPVCDTVLAQDEYLIARLFDRPGRSHVHVLGCGRCRGRRSGK